MKRYVKNMIEINNIYKKTFAIFSIILTSCATAPIRTNMTPAYLYLDPTVSIYQDPYTNLADGKTFAVFPFSLIKKENEMNEIMERQALFFLRNLFEGHGYVFVNEKEMPDFLVTISLGSKYNESYVPPQSFSLPVYNPGKTVTTNMNTRGSFNFNSNSGNAFGNYSGYGTASTYLPGYYTSQTFTRSGYTEGHYFPSISILVYDSKSLRNVWYGSGVGTSDNSDVRISGQFVANKIMSNFPMPIDPIIDTELKRGVIGIQFMILTNDGNNYFPTVLDVNEDGPADIAGLRKFDMILSIDGKQTINIPSSKFRQLCSGEPGSIVTIEVARVDERLTFQIPRIDRSNLITNSP
ncbi:MAG: DUF4136 domain-containing protein [Bacteroidia bacterium]